MAELGQVGVGVSVPAGVFVGVGVSEGKGVGVSLEPSRPVTVIWNPWSEGKTNGGWKKALLITGKCSGIRN